MKGGARCESNQRTGHTHSLIIVLLAGVLSLVFGSSVARAQSYSVAGGLPPFSAPEPVEMGFTDVSNGNLHLEISIGSFPQRPNNQALNAKFVYDSSMVWVETCSSTCVWSYNNPYQYWRYVTSAGGSAWNALYCGGQLTLCGYTFTDPMGTARSFYFTSTTCPGTNTYASDSSGYMLEICGAGGIYPEVFAPDGTIVYNGETGVSAEDSNGNMIQGPYNSPANSDTLGRAVTVTAGCGGSCYNVPNSQGKTSTYSVATKSIPVKTNFGQSGVTEYSGSFYVTTSITLPDGTSYTFKYDCDSTTGNSACGSPGGQSGYYGFLTSVTLPTGGTISYGYTTFSDSYKSKIRWLNSRQSASGTWSYTPSVISSCSPTQVGCQQGLTVKKPSGDSSVYTFTLNNGAWPVKVQSYDSSSNLLATVNNTYDFSQPCQFAGCHGAADVRLLTTQTTVYGPAAITKQTKLQYDSPKTGNITARQEWTYYPGTSPSFPSIPDHATYTTYLSTGTNDINRPLTVTLCSNSGADSQCPGGGSKVRRTVYTYDSYSACPSGLAVVTGIMNHDDTNFGGRYTTRGNATQIQNWVSGSTYVTAQECYDTTGHVYQETDPLGNVTKYSYADNFYSDNGSDPPASYTPTKPTNAYTTSIIQPIIGTSTSGYFYGSGKQAMATDTNGVTAYSHFMDPFDRPTDSDYPIGWGFAAYPSETEFDQYTAVGDTTASQNCVSCGHDQIVYDEWGRKIKEILANDPSCPSGGSEIDTSYDASGRISTVSHPYCVGGSPVYETYAYDGLDRVTSVKHPDGQSQTWLYGAKAGVPPQQSLAYGYGYPTLVTDEVGNQREIWRDGFSRTIEVDEPPFTSGTATATFYAYDAAGNLTSVTQGVQARTYVYDGMGRLAKETTPEGGTLTLAYTNGGSLCSGDPSEVCQKTDAKGITTTYCYDALNRMTQKAYVAQACPLSSPPVTYTYDQGGAAAFALGRKTSMTDSSGSESYTYNKAGRILQLQKVVGSTAYTTGYQYNPGGELTQITYPSGRIVEQSFDNIGQLCEVAPVTSACGSAPSPYTTAYAYDAASHATGFKYGNGIAAAMAYSTTRSQLTQLLYSKSSNTLFGVDYYYQSDPTNCPTGTASNNGMIECIVDVGSATGASGRTASYSYDTLGRLATAATQGTTQYPAWGLSWTYDRFGNRWTQGVTAGSAPSVSLSFGSSGLNSSTTNQPNGYTYDANGNMTVEAVPPPNNLGYDAENRLTSFSGGSGSGTYVYDDHGDRVQKTASGTSTVYIYSGDKDIAEYDNGAAPGSPSREYIYADGDSGAQLLAMTSGTSINYYHQDHLSVRLITDVNGNDIGEQGTFPFGESWYQNNTTTKWRFTSYQRDSESGLDYAMARHYDSRMGSFCSADPVEGNPNDPQTWNRYAYARNNPVNVADASGKSWVSILLDILSVALPIALPEAFPEVFSLTGGDLWFVGPVFDQETNQWAIMGLLIHSESAADVGAFAADVGQAANAAQKPPNPFSESPQFKGAKELSQKPKCRDWLTNLAQTAGKNINGGPLSPEESQYFADQIKAIPSTLDATPTSFQPVTDPSPAEGFKTNAEVKLGNPSSMTLYEGFFNETFLGSQSQIVLHEAVHLVLRYSDRQLAQAATGKIFPDTAQGRSEASIAWHDKLKKNCS